MSGTLMGGILMFVRSFIAVPRTVPRIVYIRIELYERLLLESFPCFFGQKLSLRLGVYTLAHVPDNRA